MSRPPYLRWAAAGLLIVVSLVVELRPSPTEEHPFTRREIAPGETVRPEDVEWRDVPSGLLPKVGLPLMATRAAAAGEPLLPSLAPSGGSGIPEGWWALELPVPQGTSPGARVNVVVAPAERTAPLETPGMIISPAPGDGFGPPPALVAVPSSSAAEVAVAAGEGRVTVLVGPTGNVPAWSTPSSGASSRD